MLTQSPGSVSLYLRIVPYVFLDIHGRRWDLPNTQDIHTGCLFLNFAKRLSIFPFSANFIMTGNGRRFILLCSKTKSCWYLSRILGLAISLSCNGVRFLKLRGIFFNRDQEIWNVWNGDGWDVFSIYHVFLIIRSAYLVLEGISMQNRAHVNHTIICSIDIIEFNWLVIHK